jgi:hypothetical protein
MDEEVYSKVLLQDESQILLTSIEEKKGCLANNSHFAY